PRSPPIPTLSLHDALPISETPKTAGDLGLSLFKCVKDFIDRFLFDANAGIDNASFDLIRCRVERFDSDSAFFRSKFDAVLDQVPKDLLQARGIALHVRMIRAKLKFHFEIFCFDFVPTYLVSALEDLVYANRLEA